MASRFSPTGSCSEPVDLYYESCLNVFSQGWYANPNTLVDQARLLARSLDLVTTQTRLGMRGSWWYLEVQFHCGCSVDLNIPMVMAA